MIRGKRIADAVIKILLLLFACAVVSPIIIIAVNSFSNGSQPYADFFLWKPLYLGHYVNSIFISGVASVASVIVAVLAAYVFAKKNFAGKSILFFMYIIVMMMPFQVTLLPQYIVSRQLNIFDTYGALILPAIFAPFPVFFLTQTIKTLPNDMFEAASLETSSSVIIILKILLPNLRTGMTAAFVLSFAEAWNMVEQPLVLLDDARKYPFSVIFRTLAETDPTMLFTAAVMVLVLPGLLYAFFQDELTQGLDAGNFDDYIR